ncbi:cingulin-like isoform X3 [Halichondria panicea]|uniref:cingulin-like isoform X3 n=1 Tax=Halichondria panicea TaxID=6063 RepID=UPI00312BB54D
MTSRHSPSRNSPHTVSPASSPRSPHSKRNRGTVIVEQSLVSVKADKNDDISSRKSTGSLSHDKVHMSSLHRKSTGSSISDHQRDSRSSDSPVRSILSPHSSFLPMEHTQSTDSLTQISPPDSVHSSVSSLLDTSSSVSNLTIVTSTEDRILDELKRQIAHGALHIQQLEKKVETIPLLTVKVDELERERGKLANDLLDSQAFVDSMKQRLSLLHEQNNQLVKLAHSSGGQSAELLRNRNALVASLAQIKKLQERVDSIPTLKSQVRTMTEENSHLKDKEAELSRKFPDQLPEGVTRATYQSLIEDNTRLTENNQKISGEVRTAREQLGTVTGNLESVKKRMDKFESTRSIVVPLQQRIKRLEKEKDEIYQEYVDVKFHHQQQQPTVDIDTAHLLNEVSTLKKKNSHLQAKLETVTMESRQEKEKLVLKLFELESLSMNSQKYELEKKLIETGTPSPIESRRISGSNHTPSLTRRDSIEEEMADLPAESKVQMLKLRQLRVHSEQSRSMLQSLMAERDQLERKVEELNTLIDKRALGDLEKSVEEKDYKLQLARENITKLEKELAMASVSEQSAMEVRNKEMMKELERLREVQSNYDELVADQNQSRQYREEHELLARSLQKAKDDKSKAEKRYKDGKTRLRSLAKELSNAVELIQNYQSQCMHLQDQLDRTGQDMQRVRTMSASYRTKLEMAEVEHSSHGKSELVEKDGPGIEAYGKVCKEKDGLQETVDALSKTISEQQEQMWKLKSEREELTKQLEELTKELQVSKEQLTNEEIAVVGFKGELETVKSANSSLVLDNKKLVEQIQTLQEELDKMKSDVVEFTKSKQELDVIVNGLRESEQKVRTNTDAEMIKLTQELETSQRNCEKLQKTLTDKEKCLEQETVLKQQFERDTTGLKAHTVQLTSQVDSLSKEMAGLSSQHKTTLVEVSTLRQSNIATTEEMTAKMSQVTGQLQEAVKEKQRLTGQLQEAVKEKQRLTGQLQEAAKEKQRLDGELKTLNKTSTGSHSLKMEFEATASQRDSDHRKAISSKNKDIKELEHTVTNLRDEVEAYNATIKSLQRHIEETETREVEHERLKQNFKQLEKALGTSSHDNKALFAILQQTLKELPSYSSQASRSLQDENLRLEEQVNVLSQWNDKQRNEIETLEMTIEKLEDDKVQLLIDIQTKENSAQENSQLKRELKEVEMEVGSLRRQARSELQEELQVKMDTQSQLLAVFNQHNTSLQKQVVDLTSHVQDLGGTLERDKPVSPPPMPDVALAIPRGDVLRQRSLGDLEQENYILKERIGTMEKELMKLQGVSSQFRRRSSSLRAMFSVPVRPINEELQVSVPPELLLPCSLLADYISEFNTLQGDPAESWLESIRSEWFACMAQRTLTPACAQCYISTLSRLSARLMETVINIQDEKGNTALHYAVANGNFPVARQFVGLRCCRTGLMNKAGYTPLMLAAACCVEVGEHKDIMGHLVDRGDINKAADKDQRTALMLAACSGSLEMVSLFLEKGADVNLRDKDGSSALMFASQSGHTEIVGSLLTHPHTDTSLRDNDGLTALDIAKEAGFTELMALLGKRSKSKYKR